MKGEAIFTHKNVKITQQGKRSYPLKEERDTHPVTVEGKVPLAKTDKGLRWTHDRSLLGSYLHKTITLLDNEVDEMRFIAGVQKSGNSIRKEQRMFVSGNIKNNFDSKCQRKCSHYPICCG